MLKRSGFLAAFVGVCWLGITMVAQESAAPRALPSALLEYRVPLVHARLPNGLHVVVSEDHASPVVVVNVMYRAGMRVESRSRSGLAHYFEHLMFQGTNAMDKDDYARTVNGLGGRYNGATRVDYANYYTVAPGNALDLLLWIEADRMRGLKITPEAIENQRAVVLEEVRQFQEQMRGRAPMGEVLQALAFTTWQNAHSGYGELADLQAATLDDMRAFYDRYYVPSNAVLVVVGDCDPARVIARAREYFGPIAAAPVPTRADVAEQPVGQQERSSTEKVPGARATSLALGYRMPGRTTRAFAALSLLATVLARDARGLLRATLVDDQQVASSVTGTFHDLGSDFDVDGPTLFTITVDGVPGRSAAELLAAIDEVLARACDGLSEGDLADARLRHAMWFFEQLAGPGNPHATRAKTIGAFTLFDGSPEGINRVLPDLATLTVDDLRAAARTYLVPTNRVWHARVPE